MLYLLNQSQGQYYSTIAMNDDGGNSHYNGLLTSVQHRFSHGFTALANYTFSHCISDINIGSLVGGTGAGLLDPSNRHLDRSNCQTGTLDAASANSLDRRHLGNFTAVVVSPHFAARKLDTIASNWMLSSSYRVQSASFLTVAAGTDRQLSGSNAQRAQRLLGNALCDHPNPSCWINPSAFGIPDQGTLGNSGRASVPGPGFWEIDTALSRTFNVREKVKLEARAEAFNLTNSFRAGTPTTNRTSQTFGQILTAQDPRIMQFALKLVF